MFLVGKKYKDILWPSAVRIHDECFVVQLAGKRDQQQEKEVQEWIEAVVGKKFPAGEEYEDVLRDGQVLCELMNKLKPGSIKKINTSGGDFKLMENINK